MTGGEIRTTPIRLGMMKPVVAGVALGSGSISNGILCEGNRVVLLGIDAVFEAGSWWC